MERRLCFDYLSFFTCFLSVFFGAEKFLIYDLLFAVMHLFLKHFSASKRFLFIIYFFLFIICCKAPFFLKHFSASKSFLFIICCEAPFFEAFSASKSFLFIIYYLPRRTFFNAFLRFDKSENLTKRRVNRKKKTIYTSHPHCVVTRATASEKSMKRDWFGIIARIE